MSWGQNAKPLLAWERFAADEANLTEFLNAKGKRR
jgi:hypothetical protein